MTVHPDDGIVIIHPDAVISASRESGLVTVVFTDPGTVFGRKKPDITMIIPDEVAFKMQAAVSKVWWDAAFNEGHPHH